MGRLLAIGDIHGCLTAFDALLAAATVRADDTLVLMGDYVDRGPDSRGVLDRVIELRRHCRLVPLLGNHEEMMCEARTEPDTRSMWLLCGGEQTLASYGPAPTSAASSAERLATVPPSHWAFLDDACREVHETSSHIFVHAGLLAHLPLAVQPRDAMLWRKLPSWPRPHVSGKVVVVGHTRQPNGVPRSWGHTVALDTGAYADQWLTCLDVEREYLWQANERGETRHGPFAALGVITTP